MLLSQKQHKPFFGALIALLFFVFVLSLSLGAFSLSIKDIRNALSGEGTTYLNIIVFQLRLPRSLMAMAIGGLLACSGMVMQSLFRNPLADPSLIGVTAGASLGASLAIFFGLSLSFVTDQFSWLHFSLTSVGACLGGAFSVLFIYRLSTHRGRTSVSTMLLGGIALTALVGGVNNLLELLSDSEVLRRLSLWKMGSFEGANYAEASIAALFLFLSYGVLRKHAATLNAFLLGESEASYLGIHVQKMKFIFVSLVALSTGLSVALAGTIAFVGLVVPHIMRILVGPDHHRLIPACAMGGAILALIADLLARTVLIPAELPVGLVTSIIGAPFFIFLLLQVHRIELQR